MPVDVYIQPMYTFAMLNFPTELLTPATLRQMTENAEAVEAMKPRILTTYRRLEKLVTLNPGVSKGKLFSLISIALVVAYKAGADDNRPSYRSLEPSA